MGWKSRRCGVCGLAGREHVRVRFVFVRNGVRSSSARESLDHRRSNHFDCWLQF